MCESFHNSSCFFLQVLDEGNPRITEFTITILHTPNSTASAFFIETEEVIPSDLFLINITSNEENDQLIVLSEVLTATNKTLIRISTDVLPLDDNITVVYLAQMDPQLSPGGNVTKEIVLNYKSIKQEGIGLLVCVLYFSSTV